MASDYLGLNDGGKLYFEVRGEGHPIVLIHAGFLDSRMWNREFELYAKQFKVIRYDVRGFGRSSRPTEKFSDSRDLYSLLKHLGVERTYLLGVSNGGRIAFDFVSEHPELVDGLVAVGTGIRGYKMSGPEEEKLWDEYDVKVKPREDAQKKAIEENRIGDAVRMEVDIWTAAHDQVSRRRVLEIAMDNAHTQTEHPGKLQMSPQPPAFKRLSEIKVPTLLIVGNKDVPMEELMAKRLHSLIPGSEMVLLQGADHIANISNPEEFNRTVLEFLQKIPSAPIEQPA